MKIERFKEVTKEEWSSSATNNTETLLVIHEKNDIIEIFSTNIEIRYFVKEKNDKKKDEV
jgi:hypothetical protein